MDRFQARRFLSSWQLVSVFVLAVSLGASSAGGMATLAVAQDSGEFAHGVVDDPIQGVTVDWPDGWSAQAGNGSGDTVADLQNKDGSIRIHIEGASLDGLPLDQMATAVRFEQSTAMGSIAGNGQIQINLEFPTGDNSWGFALHGDTDTWLTQVSLSSDSSKAVVATVTVPSTSDLGAVVAQVQGITINDAPLLQGFELFYPPTTAAAAPPATAASEPPPTDTAAGGQYTIPAGNVNVVWPAVWTVYAQTEESITVTNAAQTMLLQIMVIPVAGRTWDQLAADEVSFQMSGQGANGTVSGPVMTDSGFWFTSDGEQGPFMEQGIAAADPAMFIRINTGNIAPGSDLTALATEAHGVTVDGKPALEGIEAVIPPAA